MEIQSHSGARVQNTMLPPPTGTFLDREDLIKHVRDFGASQGYVVTIKKSRRDSRVILGCDRGGVYRNRRKIEENKRKRKACSRLINCPFEAIGKKEDDIWVLTIKNGSHNHEPLKDMSEHPYSRRFTEEEVRQIKLMTEAGIKPCEVLKALKQTNPELQSTPRHLYNLKAKIRTGNLSEKSFKSWRPNRSIPVNASAEVSGQQNTPMKVHNLIGGKFVESQACEIVDVINPATQEVVSQVPLTTYEEFKAAVSAAKQAFPAWRKTPVTTRQRIMFKLQELIRRDIDKLATNISIEQGKTLNGAKGDVLRGLEVVEHACGMATLQMGQFIPNASSGIDTYCIREPLGVCAGISPFNFPAMISLWMFPIAITCGNTYILRPNQKNPGASMILAALAIEAGLPDGVLNIVHGTHEIVNYICDDEDIKAISYIGSNTAGKRIYARAAPRGKRVQSNMGAKNHAIIMRDASADATLDALVTAGFGAAGQRCMTLSTAVFVGGSSAWEEELVKRAKALKVNSGTEAGADLGPVISKEAKETICKLVQSGVDSGARLVLDGRNIVVPRYESGNFVGPTILCDVTTSMECYKEEMFGPVLLCMKANSLEEAIAIVNRNTYGHGASIFTTSSVAAREFQNEVEAGLVGINVPVPIPMLWSSFNGSKASFAGDINFSGMAGVQFYTQIKTVAQQWKDLPSRRVSLSLPVASETEVSSRAGSQLQHPTSESDFPSREVSPAMPSASEIELPCHIVPLPQTSEGELQNPVMSPSIPATTGRNLQSNEGLLTMPSTSDRDLINQEMSLSMPPATERDLLDPMTLSKSPISERMHIPLTSHWDDTRPLTSSQRTDTFLSTSESNNTAPTSQRIDYIPPTSLSKDTAVALTPERLYTPATHRNDAIGPMSPRTDAPVSEKVHGPTISNVNENVGSTSQMADTTTHLNSERLYMLAPHRKDNIGLMSLRTDICMHPAVGEIYMTTSYGSDTVPSKHAADMHPTTEKMYMPAEIRRTNGMPSTPKTSTDEYPDQGVSPTLPTSQRS